MSGEAMCDTLRQVTFDRLWQLGRNSCKLGKIGNIICTTLKNENLSQFNEPLKSVWQQSDGNNLSMEARLWWGD